MSAKGNTNGLSWYSSYGNTTITASGGNRYPPQYNSGTCYNNETCSDIWGSPQQYNYSNGPAYTSYEGTSQATPHVSAAVADLIAYFNNIGKSYNLATIITILQQSSSTLANNSNANATVGTQGYGGTVSGQTLNANNALLYAETHYTSNVLLASPLSWVVTSYT